MKTRGKLAALIAVIAGTLAWLGREGMREGGAYYLTVAEIRQMGGSAQGKRLRVAGDVETGSIVREGRRLAFVLREGDRALRVSYEGADPAPDTFRDGVQALADGRMGADGVFHASRIQTKCASRYQGGSGSHPSGVRKAAF